MSALFGGLGAGGGGNTANTKPTLTLGTTSTTANPGSSSLFGGSFAKPAINISSINNPQPNATSTAQPASSSNGPQIDVAHLRSTTKFDHLVPALATDIENEDKAILNQMNHCGELADLLPSVVAAGKQIAPAIDFVSSKLEELELGLENDAEAIVGLRDGDVKGDEGEVKCVFRAVDRLKVPRQYQIGHTVDIGANGPMALSGGTGLTGWWNQPHALRGARAASSGHSMQLVDEDADEGSNEPKSLVELLDNRAESMKKINEQHKQLLSEVEDFVGGLEDKIVNKERELNDRLNYGNRAETLAEEERERQMQMLRYVFGEVQRELYEMADKVGTTRDSIIRLGMSG